MSEAEDEGECDADQEPEVDDADEDVVPSEHGDGVEKEQQSASGDEVGDDQSQKRQQSGDGDSKS